MKLRLTAFVALFVACSNLFAQSAATSQIAGTVQDSSGLGIPGAQVKAIQTDTGLTRNAETGADGGYILLSLPIGPYRLEVSKQGFSTYVQNGIVLQVDSNPTIDAKLQVGAVTSRCRWRHPRRWWKPAVPASARWSTSSAWSIFR